jgi:hypothetical protein
MPSGGAGEAGAEGADLGRAGAVFPAGAAAAGESCGRARAGAETAMQAATALGHGGLAARAAAAGAGAAAGRRQEVAGAVAVLEAAAALGRGCQWERVDLSDQPHAKRGNGLNWRTWS